MEKKIEENIITLFLIDDKYRVYRHLLLQLAILMITVGNFFDAPDRLNITLNRFYGFIGYYVFLNALVYFTAYVLFPCFLAKNKMFLYVVSSLLFTFFMMVVMMILQQHFYDIGIIHQEPSVVVIIFNIVGSILSILLFLGGISALLLFRQWMISNMRIHALEAATSESELKFLKSQINPHFLFNMLNNANILIDEEPETASYILLKLDELLQYQLNGSMMDKVSLEADIRFLNNYLELEKMRRDNFGYTIDIQGDPDGVQVAPLLFIPFIENAVKHNMSAESASFIHITFDVQADRLFFTCINSVPAKEDPGIKGGLGLANIRRRLDLLFGSNYLLEQDKTDKVYTVKLQIKL